MTSIVMPVSPTEKADRLKVSVHIQAEVLSVEAARREVYRVADHDGVGVAVPREVLQSVGGAAFLGQVIRHERRAVDGPRCGRGDRRPAGHERRHEVVLDEIVPGGRHQQEVGERRGRSVDRDRDLGAGRWLGNDGCRPVVPDGRPRDARHRRRVGALLDRHHTSGDARPPISLVTGSGRAGGFPGATASTRRVFGAGSWILETCTHRRTARSAAPGGSCRYRHA